MCKVFILLVCAVTVFARPGFNGKNEEGNGRFSVKPTQAQLDAHSQELAERRAAHKRDNPNTRCGTVDFRGYTISDYQTRVKLYDIADHFCTRLWVTSGDRQGSGGSLHDVGRAGDWWLDGYDGTWDGAVIFDEMRRVKASLFGDESWEVIWHGPYTCTGGEHQHVGRFGDGQGTCFKEEGSAGWNICDYRCVETYP